MADVVWTFHVGGTSAATSLDYALLYGEAPAGGNSTTSFSFTHGSDRVEFGGSFTVDAQGRVTGGTITDFSVYHGSQMLLEATGYAIGVAAFAFALADFRANPQSGPGVQPKLYQLFDAEAREVRGSIDGDYITGSGFADVLRGKAGHDAIIGWAGDDVMSGGSGKDSMEGGSGRDRMSGGKGADYLGGGEDRDVLTGGAGKDKFLFAEFGSDDADRVTDFKPGVDSILLAGDVFQSLPFGALKAKYFAIGKADDANDYIIYKPKTGELFYDPDGSGNQYSRAVFAKLSGAPAISADDFTVV